MATAAAAAQDSPPLAIGMAKIDITPEGPIRLSGYGGRGSETSRVEQRLFARAIAIGSDGQEPAIIVAAELIGIAEEMRDAVAASLWRKHRINPARVAVCTTHTHTGPSVRGVLPFLFSSDLPREEEDRISRFSDVLQARLIQVAEAALADRKPGRLGWAEGRVGFTGHRRVVTNGKWTAFGRDPDGPVDYALPALRVTDDGGGIRGVVLNYACHCTTLRSEHNFIHGDWAGEASARIEAAHPGAIALIAAGCGGDSNPDPRGELEHVAAHGASVAAELERLLAGEWRALGPVTAASYRRIELAFDRVPDRAELVARTDGAQRPPARFAASKFLARLDAGQPLPRGVPYPIQTWAFGRDLAMVFLSGEVVVEYALRLRRELGGAPLWVNAYANSVPCYVASKRMFSEGGYEVDASMDYYGWPGRLALETEDNIVRTVREMVPPSFQRAAGPR
jgi:neutral ceramidase